MAYDKLLLFAADLVRDGRLSERDGRALEEMARADGAVSATERQALVEVLREHSDALEPSAKQELQALIGNMNEPQKLVLAKPRETEQSVEPPAPKVRAAYRNYLQKLLREQPSMLRRLGADVRADPELVRVAVQTHPSNLDYAAFALRDDKDFVRPLIATSGKCYLSVSERLRETDHELLELAISDYPAALRKASEHFRADQKRALALIKRDPNVYFYVTPALKRDHQVIEQMLRSVGSLAFEHFFPEDVRRHPKVLATAMQLCPELFEKLPDALQSSREFLEPIAEMNPLALRYMSDEARRLLEDRVDLFERWQSVEQELEQLDIAFPERLRPFSVLEEIIANRKAGASSDDRPLAVLFFPKRDDNGAFLFNETAELIKTHRVVYHEVGDDHDLVATLNQLTAAGQTTPLLVIGGHGSTRATSFGAADPPDEPLSNENEAAYLDPSDAAQIGDLLQRAVAQGGHIVLKSCNTGAEREAQLNNANFVASLAPQAFVHAPVRVTHASIQLDDAGRFVSAGFAGGREETYTIPPAAREAD